MFDEKALSESRMAAGCVIFLISDFLAVIFIGKKPCLYQGKRGVNLFYVVQVAPGMEERTEQLIWRRVESRLYDRCFHPMRHMRKKFHGQWKDLHEKLLPGYVFIQSGRIAELYGELLRIPMLTKVLGREENWFCALPEQEVAWLELLISEEWICKENEEKGTGTREKESELDNGIILKKSKRVQNNCFVEIGLSQVIVEENAVRILSGPLKNMEGYIRKIHLHRRIAEVVVDFMGKKTVVYLGIEMVGLSKKEEESL